MSNLELPKKMRVAEASKTYSIGKSTIFRWIAQGKLKAVRPSPRITLLDTLELEAFINGEVQNG